MRAWRKRGSRGGDGYYFSVCSSGRVTRLFLADVLGHGEQVARAGHWFYQQMAGRLDDPDLPHMMSELNACVFTRGVTALTTSVILSYYVDLLQVYYCYAGHPFALIRRGSGPWLELKPPSERAGNFPLGVTEDVHYDMSYA